jgi:hypothetical protein
MSSSRLLFKDVEGKFVIKIDHAPSTSYKYRQTAREIDFWETLQEDKEFFAQILDYGKTPQGFWWLRQKWYEPDDTDYCTTQNFTTLNDLVFKYNIKDIEPHWFDGSGNWMLHKGEVIIYDWGL